jgi:hypothetical protein
MASKSSFSKGCKRFVDHEWIKNESMEIAVLFAAKALGNDTAMKVLALGYSLTCSDTKDPRMVHWPPTNSCEASVSAS